jgi:hypothetical protein
MGEQFILFKAENPTHVHQISRIEITASFARCARKISVEPMFVFLTICISLDLVICEGLNQHQFSSTLVSKIYALHFDEANRQSVNDFNHSHLTVWVAEHSYAHAIGPTYR